MVATLKFYLYIISACAIASNDMTYSSSYYNCVIIKQLLPNLKHPWEISSSVWLQTSNPVPKQTENSWTSDSPYNVSFVSLFAGMANAHSGTYADIFQGRAHHYFLRM